MAEDVKKSKPVIERVNDITGDGPVLCPACKEEFDNAEFGLAILEGIFGFKTRQVHFRCEKPTVYPKGFLLLADPPMLMEDAKMVHMEIALKICEARVIVPATFISKDTCTGMYIFIDEDLPLMRLMEFVERFSGLIGHVEGLDESNPIWTLVKVAS